MVGHRLLGSSKIHGSLVPQRHRGKTWNDTMRGIGTPVGEQTCASVLCWLPARLRAQPGLKPDRPGFVTVLLRRPAAAAATCHCCCPRYQPPPLLPVLSADHAVPAVGDEAKVSVWSGCRHQWSQHTCCVSRNHLPAKLTDKRCRSLRPGDMTRRIRHDVCLESMGPVG
jgi:hypothetical protein